MEYHSSARYIVTALLQKVSKVERNPLRLDDERMPYILHVDILYCHVTTISIPTTPTVWWLSDRVSAMWSVLGKAS